MTELCHMNIFFISTFLQFLYEMNSFGINLIFLFMFLSYFKSDAWKEEHDVVIFPDFFLNIWWLKILENLEQKLMSALP